MSPAATLDPTEARTAALAAADDLFYTRGVAAVTVAEVRDRSGVSLRRLYTMDPSKSDLVAAWLEFRHVTWMTGFSERVASEISQGEAPVDAVFNALEQWMTATTFRGCGFINTHAESSELTEQHRSTIRMHKTALADYLQETIGHGAALAVLVDGAIVQASIFGNAEPIHAAHQAAQTLIGNSQ
jgi:AcrR family transcriptional regulator